MATLRASFEDVHSTVICDGVRDIWSEEMSDMVRMLMQGSKALRKIRKGTRRCPHSGQYKGSLSRQNKHGRVPGFHQQDVNEEVRSLACPEHRPCRIKGESRELSFIITCQSITCLLKDLSSFPWLPKDKLLSMTFKIANNRTPVCFGGQWLPSLPLECPRLKPFMDSWA